MEETEIVPRVNEHRGALIQEVLKEAEDVPVLKASLEFRSDHDPKVRKRL